LDSRRVPTRESGRTTFTQASKKNSNRTNLSLAGEAGEVWTRYGIGRSEDGLPFPAEQKRFGSQPHMQSDRRSHRTRERKAARKARQKNSVPGESPRSVDEPEQGNDRHVKFHVKRVRRLREHDEQLLRYLYSTSHNGHWQALALRSTYNGLMQVCYGHFFCI
jgi:hypothetical protein